MSEKREDHARAVERFERARCERDGRTDQYEAARGSSQ
jgi:hypothetical protein